MVFFYFFLFVSFALDGRVFVYFSTIELYSSLIGGGNAIFIVCQPPLNLIEYEFRQRCTVV